MYADYFKDPYQLLPPLTDDEYDSLKQDIIERGVIVPVIFDEDGNVLDGHHRKKICEELGLVYPSEIKSGLSETEKRSLARSLNMKRRHLNRQQKRMLIAEELTDNPTLSNLALATLLGVSDVTVAKVRRELGLTGDVVGADGKTYASVRQENLSERLAVSLVFADQDDYDAWQSITRYVKRQCPGQLITQGLIEFFGDCLPGDV